MVIDWLLYGPKREWRAEARHSNQVNVQTASMPRRTMASERSADDTNLLGEADRAADGVGDRQLDLEGAAATELVRGELRVRRLRRTAVAEVPAERMRGAAERVAAAVHVEADVLGVLAVAVGRRALAVGAEIAEVDVLGRHFGTTADLRADVHLQGGGNGCGRLRVGYGYGDVVVAGRCEGEGRRRVVGDVAAVAEGPGVAGDRAARGAANEIDVEGDRIVDAARSAGMARGHVGAGVGGRDVAQIQRRASGSTDTADLDRGKDGRGLCPVADRESDVVGAG